MLLFVNTCSLAIQYIFSELLYSVNMLYIIVDIYVNILYSWVWRAQKLPSVSPFSGNLIPNCLCKLFIAIFMNKNKFPLDSQSSLLFTLLVVNRFLICCKSSYL